MTPTHRIKKTSAELFAMAADALIASLPHGEAQRIAKVMGVRASYLSDLRAGRRPWTDRLRDALCIAFHVSVADVYLMAEELDRTGHLFPYPRQVRRTGLHTLERAYLIWSLSAREFHLDFSEVPAPGTDYIQGLPATRQYLKGSMSDGGYLQYTRDIFSSILKHYITKPRKN